MSFNIALSGISAAQKDLNTTANNIANANTIGFKESRAEFADVYANSIFQMLKLLSVVVLLRVKWHSNSIKVAYS